jgi:transcriptional regulator with XRE-family HTH domain
MKQRVFGARLTQLREKRELSVTQLARLLDIDYMQISRYEKGQTLPSLETAAGLARVLQVSLDELVTGAGLSESTTFQNGDLFDRMRALDQLPKERQQMALRVLDAVIAGYELESLSDRLRR